MRIDPKTFTFDINDRVALRVALEIAIREERAHEHYLSRPENIERCRDNVAKFEDLLERINKGE